MRPTPMTDTQQKAEAMEHGELLTEAWLAGEAGFKWSQAERQTHKHWTLWLGWASEDGGRLSTIEDLGIEVTMAWWTNRNGDVVGDETAWNCWLKGMNRSLLHVRYIRTRAELIALIEALTGQPWNAAHSRFGNLYSARQIERFDREEAARAALRTQDQGDSL